MRNRLAAIGLPVAALSFLLAGAVLWWPRTDDALSWSFRTWMAGLALTGAPVVWKTVRGMLRGEFAADVVAMLAIVTALALGQPFAGLVVVLMLTGGEALERYAEGRAGAAVAALEQAAPRQAHVQRDDGSVADIPAEQVRVGDLLLVRPGELVPCDGEVVAGRSHVDASAITGEPLGVPVGAGSRVVSGASNVDGPLTIRALATAGESQYARIVQLVRAAQGSKAPIQRMADRAAVWFTPATLAVCAIAWLLTRDMTRVLSVLVVATPCPLILATPIAIIGGINRAARRQVIVRTGGAMESLGRVTTAVFDKTGTLTHGQPAVHRIVANDGIAERDVLRLAGAVDFASGHQLARPLVLRAERETGELPPAHDVQEVAGRGISGTIDGRRVTLGSLAFVQERLPAAARPALDVLASRSEGLRAFVAVDDAPAGVIEYADSLRSGLPAFFDRLHALGVRRTLLLSGDHATNVASVAHDLGARFDEVRGDLLPQDKARIIGELEARGERTMMVGDGTNDAPALTAAHVGVALAGHGGGISAEAADVVLLVDDVTRVADAIATAQRAVRIARQSIVVGLGLSLVGMLVAAAGYLAPTYGALVQEAIDVAVILNALRAAAE
ncbi:MAG: heavy metal translocating P-type ATPase [Gemmatimonadaceae bacterium]|jgi:heavy metal translocating P-type ATPase|nr:heavy metal translocating P-type ATPase [Gemmatimonadaceae bacterium]